MNTHLTFPHDDFDHINRSKQVDYLSTAIDDYLLQVRGGQRGDASSMSLVCCFAISRIFSSSSFNDKGHCRVVANRAALKCAIFSHGAPFIGVQACKDDVWVRPPDDIL